MPDGPRITHNEDGDPGFAGHCGIGLFSPDNGPRFASFVYPASIPGHTFAVTQAGLAMTVIIFAPSSWPAGCRAWFLTASCCTKSAVRALSACCAGDPRQNGKKQHRT